MTISPYAQAGPSTDGGFLNTAGDMLGNRDFQNMLASVGGGLDPQGAAGALGGATQQFNQAQSQQEFLKKLLDQLGSKGKIKMGADGGVEVTAGEKGEGGSQDTKKSESDLGDLDLESRLDKLLGAFGGK